MLLRKLNREGVQKFDSFINELRNGGNKESPHYLLSEEMTSEALTVNIEIDHQDFGTRYELGVFLCQLFKDIDMQGYVGDVGFWSALALFWFDQLCPEKTDGNRKPAMVYNYILSQNYNHRPRHAIFTTWQLVNQYGEDARFMLCRELPVRGELVEQMMARQYYLSCEGVMKTASYLYYDEKTNNFKRGAAARKSAGCVSRYVTWLQQMELTYDLFSISSKDLLGLLPAEFERFKGSTT